MQNASEELDAIQASISALAENGVILRKQTRRFILQDDLSRVKKGEVLKPYHVFLFNDMILYTEKSSSKKGLPFKYVGHALLKDILFIDSADSKGRHCFEILHKEEKKRVMFVAKAYVQKATWKHFLETHIEMCCPTASNSSTSTDESMVSFGSPSNSWGNSLDFYGLGSPLGSSPEYDASDDDHSINGSPNVYAHIQKEDWSSTNSGEESCEDSDETKSEENDSEEKSMMGEDGSLVLSSASLNTILWWLLYYGDYSDPILFRTFLCSYSAFANAEELFNNLLQIYDLTLPVPKILTLRYSLCDTRKRVATFLKIWLEYYFERDFANNKHLYEMLLNFLGELKNNDQGGDANVLKITILRANKKKLAKKGLNRFSQLTPPPTPKQTSSRALLGTSGSSLPLPLGQPTDTKLIEWNVTTIAEQFALIEFSLFKQVDLKELCNLSWKSAHPKKTALNVVNLFTRFDMVSQWAATEVVMAHSLRQRVAVIEKLIQLAQKCSELRNYNSLMEILGGLNRGSVQRMKKAWEAVSQSSRETFQALNVLVDPRRNYKNYRDQLKRNIVPCLPYVGMYLRDLTFTEEAMENKDGELINFQKIQVIAKILKEFLFFQKSPYQFDDDENLQPMLRRLLAMPEEMLYKHSQSIEPSNSN